MKRASLIVIAGITATVLIALLLRPVPRRGSVSVSFLGFTNDSAGTRCAVFVASNTTGRLLVRGRSDLERQSGTSNTISVLHVKALDYLKPGRSIRTTVPCPEECDSWRVSFYYIGQMHRREQVIYGLGWFLLRNGLIPSRWSELAWIPKHEIHSISSPWVGGTATGILRSAEAPAAMFPR